MTRTPTHPPTDTGAIGAERSTRGVQCWPEGYANSHACDNEIPDTDGSTLDRFGWGWVWARDDFSASGIGPFYACPEHRDDCTEEERQVARERYAKALLAQAPSPATTPTGVLAKGGEPLK